MIHNDITNGGDLIQTNTIISELIDKINTYTIEGETFRALFAYNEKVSPVPIDKTYIAFSTDSTSISFFDDDNSQCCKRTEVTIAVDFYSASNRKARDVYSLMESIMDYLLAEYAGKMTDYTAGQLQIDDNMRLLKLPCTMKFTYEQCPAYGVGGDVILPFADFLCKTHVNDSSVHLTESEKQFVSSPYITGAYTGDGETFRKIDIGFRPKLLLIFANSTAGFSYQNDVAKSYFGFAANGKCSKGMSLWASGFAVEYGDDVTAFGVKPQLNALGQSYTYVAF